MSSAVTSPEAAGVIVVGGGLAGLTAACYLARAGVAVTLFERAGDLGGRAATEDCGGFRFNRGLHALYTGGAASAVLRDLGIAYGYGVPPGTFALGDGRLSPVPAGAGALLRSDLLDWRDKLALGRLFATLPRLDPRALARVSVLTWIDGATPRPAVRRLLASIARPFVYSAALDLVSAEVFVGKVQTVLQHPVHYLDGGWQSLVDALRDAAERAGARIVAGARVAAVAHRDGRACGVRLGDGEARVGAVIVATGLREAMQLIPDDSAPALHRAAAGAAPARVACLDVALRRLPDARHTVVQDLDGPRFLSAQSAYARIAPEGAALVGVFKQLDPRLPGDPRADERDLEGLLDVAQPGWRDLVVRRAYLPRIEAVGWLPTANGGGLAGRPGPQAAGLVGLALAGDWVGPEGFLADASFASAREAARLILGSKGTTARERALAETAR